MYIYTSLLRLTYTMTSQNIDLSFWDTCIRCLPLIIHYQHVSITVEIIIRVPYENIRHPDKFVKMYT